MSRDRYPALVLAGVATGTSICMSVLAGWQRGGWLAERIVWVAIGVVLVAGAHLLPALCRSIPVAVRLTGGLLWLGCMGATACGHSTFFLLSQQHAGAVRASMVPVVAVAVHRDLPAIMSERAGVVATLATANARRCVAPCPTLQGRRDSLTARLDALDAEADQVRRYQAAEDGNTSSRRASQADPVTSRLAASLGLPEGRLDLLAGLAYAGTLECVACLLWWIALLPEKQSVVDNSAVTPAVQPVVTVTGPATPQADPSPVARIRHASTRRADKTDIARLKRDIESGIVRPTVTNIRQHLGCSQAKAAALRRQVVSSTS